MTSVQRTLLSLALTLAFATGSSRAQNTVSPSPSIAQPTSPAPTVVTAPVPSDPTVPSAPSTAAATQPKITQFVYTPKLPSAQELTDAAAAQGFTVERISQTSLQVIAFYRNASGQAVTVAYQTLPPAAVAQTPAAPVVVSTAPPTVVYQQAPRVIYYEDDTYYPRYWYPPVSLSFGFGYYGGHGFGHRGYYGGFRGHR